VAAGSIWTRVMTVNVVQNDPTPRHTNVLDSYLLRRLVNRVDFHNNQTSNVDVIAKSWTYFILTAVTRPIKLERFAILRLKSLPGSNALAYWAHLFESLGHVL
jgi:hypothetical protein